MVRPFPFLAACLMLLALAFYIVAASSAHWLVSYQPNVQVHEGVYNSCWRQHDAAIDECRHVNNDCSADFSPPVDSFTLTDACNELRAVRAFVVLSIIFAGLAFLALYLLSYTKLPYLTLRVPAMVLSFITGLCGLIAWAIFISLSRDKTGYSDTSAISNYEYGFSFALATAAWPLSWLALLFSSIPWPYDPTAYDRSRYQSAQPYAPATASTTAESQSAERERALRAGGLSGPAGRSAGLSDRLWGVLGVSPDKRKGYAEKWGGGSGGYDSGSSGQYGGGYGEAQARREAGARGREEEAEEGRRLRYSGGEERGTASGGQSVLESLRAGGGGSGSGGSGGGASSLLAGSTHSGNTPTTTSSERRAEEIPVTRVHL